MVAALKAKTKRQRPQNFTTLYTVTDGSLLREAGIEQVRQVLRAFMAVQTYAAGDVRVA